MILPRILDHCNDYGIPKSRPYPRNGRLLRKSADAILKVCGSSSQNLQTLIATQCIGSEQQVPSILLEPLGGG
jgi:hypothetical protein